MNAPKSLRRPTNWQDFETLCKKLWGEIWNCPEIKKNGRSGQNQNGVDVYGIPEGEMEYYGIQSKGKDEYTDKQFTEEEILTEIENAKKFTPTLKKFYLATTAVKDVKIEAFVRQKNIEQKQNGLFEVHIFSWEDIVDLIDENRQTHDWYVKSQGYKTNKEAILTFQDNSQILTASVKFKQKIISYKQRNHYEVMLQYPKGLLDFNKWGPIHYSPFDNSINNSYYEFFFRLYNVGTDPIEEFKIFFTIEGEYQDFLRVRNWSGIVPPNNPIPYDTFLNEEKSGGKINPRKSILVSEDSMAFNDLRIKPIHQPSSVKIRWRLTSKDYKTEGLLAINFTPEIVKEQEVILVEDPLQVRIEEGPIEDYITYP